mmetsp:Transcript_45716/g.98995  ORF Transcript_45716/g.98995 Transcript_45716/m.98995 type:complete len:187 (+) Transcript_45716:487-1047(+)
MKRLLRSFVESKYRLQLLLFPEGTDLSKSNLEKSHAFSKERGLARYDHVLHPRTKGFITCVRGLQQQGHLDSVYDLTLGFPDVVPQNEVDIVLNANHPREIHIFLKRTPSSQLPTDDVGLDKWCKDQFAAKEAMLREFESSKVGLVAAPLTTPQKFPGLEVSNTNDWMLHIVAANVVWVIVVLALV